MFTGLGLTTRQYDGVRKLLSKTYLGTKSKFKKRWSPAQFLFSSPKFRAPFPCPLPIVKIRQVGIAICEQFGLQEVNSTSDDYEVHGARFSIIPVLRALINQRHPRPNHVHVQILGDGFNALGRQFLNIGVRLLLDDELDNSFTSIATL